MKKRSSSKALLALFTLGMLYAVLSLDWRGRSRAPTPRVTASFHGPGEGWIAGAARTDLTPGLPVTVAGYPPQRPVAKSSGPLWARAVVLGVQGQKAIGLVSAEVLEVPDLVAGRVREAGRALGLADVLVTATHTHSSFGGYDRRLVAQIAGTGRFQQEREAHLVQRLSEALKMAQASAGPVQLRLGRVALTGLTANRDAEDGPVDDQLSVLAIDRGEVPLAAVAVFGSHPTLVPRDTERLDGDWPGAAMRAMELARPVVMVLQGAIGDTSSRPPEGEGTAAERMGARVAKASEGVIASTVSLSPSLAWAAVELGLPRAEADHAVPGFLRRPAANLLHALAPRTAEVAVLRLPGYVFLCVPVEPTVAAARAMREAVAPLLEPQEQVVLVSLAQGYEGYAEEAEATRRGAGEARRTLFGPELVERLSGALVAGLKATRSE